MANLSRARFNPPSDRQVQSFGFILLPGYALMSFAAATEPLRAANLIAGRRLYDVVLYRRG